jgi:outer membrane protein TolC
MTRFRLQIAIALLSLATGPAHAADVLSLADAQATARAHAPEAAALAARLAGTEAIASDARRAIRLDPSLSGAYAPGRVIGKPEETAWQIGLRWPLDLSGSWQARGASAQADRDRTSFERDDGLRALDEMVAIAVADVARAQRALTRADLLLALYGVANDAARKQLKVGQGTRLDADAADLDLASARAATRQVFGHVEEARVRLARFLGRETGAGLAVEDPDESTSLPPPADLEDLVQNDPRVLAAHAELRAARLELTTYERMMLPVPTLGVDYSTSRRDIPAGSFSGSSGVEDLSANWTDAELGFSVTVPLPLFDRQTQPRAKASARMFAATAQLDAARADVRAELGASWATLQAAANALDAVAQTPTVIERDFTLLEQALRAGEIDAVARAQSLRRLQDAGQSFDTVVYGLRVARAHWIRTTASRSAR